MADQLNTAPLPIVALDVPDLAGAMRIVRTLGDACGFYKVGSELFTAEGPDVVRALRTAGKEVFLDLKFHDIPNTVRAGVRSAARLGVRLVTVHGAGGAAMLQAARDGADEGAADRGESEGNRPRCGVLAVTVLTSMDAAALGGAWGRVGVVVRDEVLRLAGLAADAGLHGVVCSGDEAAAVRGAHGARLARLVPGVRLAGGAAHDQARVVTPAEAAAAGATYVVLGRAVTAAPDPAAAMERATGELLGRVGPA
jgi:orotidine-5'-phosphate decarboxylase